MKQRTVLCRALYLTVNSLKWWDNCVNEGLKGILFFLFFQVFEAACQWLRYDPQSRQQNACRILQNIRLALLDLPFLENVVLKSEFFRTCPQCQLLISNAIRTKQDQSQLERITPRAQPPCIYVIGGRNSEQCQLSSMERYDFLTNEWFTMVNA